MLEVAKVEQKFRYGFYKLTRLHNHQKFSLGFHASSAIIEIIPTKFANINSGHLRKGAQKDINRYLKRGWQFGKLLDTNIPSKLSLPDILIGKKNDLYTLKQIGYSNDAGVIIPSTQDSHDDVRINPFIFTKMAEFPEKEAKRMKLIKSI